MVAENAYSYWRDVPIVVYVSEPLSQHSGCGGSCFVNVYHLGEDALACAVVGQFLRCINERTVIGREDQIFAACGTGLFPFLQASMIVNGR